MRLVVPTFLICAVCACVARADQPAPGPGNASGLKLDAVSNSTAPGGTKPAAKPAADADLPAPKFSDAQIARVTGWMHDLAPSCPPAPIASAAQRFLEELQWQQPDKMDRLLTDSVSAHDFESMLLRHLARQLSSAPQAPLREQLAGERVRVLLAESVAGSTATPQAAAALLGKLKNNAPVYYRQLLEGHIDDDDLVPLLKETRLAGTAAAHVASAKPQALTADDILAAFSEHNQTNLALQKMRAYKLSGTLTENGQEQKILLFKLRPDRFRFHCAVNGSTRYILASNGTKCWLQAPGKKTLTVSLDEIGSKRHLAEFVNPLFGETENFSFERLDDGTIDGRKVYRVAVRRPDGSHYVACIDPATFHEIADELDQGAIVRNSDFRAIGGLTMAFRQETTNAKGEKNIFVLNEFTPNPGLIQEFFEAQPGHDENYFVFEKLLAGAPLAAQP
jgi:outer membrane lipoprotein-sorting protein